MLTEIQNTCRRHALIKETNVSALRKYHRIIIIIIIIIIVIIIIIIVIIVIIIKYAAH